VRLVERMTGSPPNCFNCGKGNTPDGDSGEIGPFLDMQREVNWDDDVYLCTDCATEIGAMVNMLTKDEVQDLERKNKQLKKKVHDLEAEMDIRKRRESQALRKARAVA
jgi:hypothetical protein